MQPGEGLGVLTIFHESIENKEDISSAFGLAFEPKMIELLKCFP